MARPLKRVALDELVKVLDRVPLVGGIKNDLNGLRALLYERRAPRIAIIGQADSGRSSLLRALIERRDGTALRADHDEWVHIAHESAKVEWLELDVRDPDLAAKWRAAIDRHPPDLVLVAVEPSRVDEGAEVVKKAESLLADLPEGVTRPRMFPLLTHSDLIGNADSDVEDVRRRVAKTIRDLKLHADPVRAVSAITSHGLHGLSEAIVLAVPEEARVEAARALTRASEGRLRIGNQIVHACTSISVTVGITPIPFSDMALLGPLQAMMVSAVAYLSGRSWSPRTVAEWLASLGLAGGLAFGLRYSAQTVLKLIPGAGNVISAGIAGAGTTTMGQSAIAYFLRDT